MANFTSPADFAREIERLERDMERQYPVWGAEIGKRAQAEGYRAAAADLGGDPKFSGWRPWLELRVAPKKYGASLIPTRASAGPWTVAQQGRNQGGSSGFAGPGVNRRTGLTSRTQSGAVRKVRASRGRRWNGYTSGKNTADDAQARFDRLAESVTERNYRVTLKRHFD